MKKKAFAALAAAVLLCGALTAPAAAEQTYKKGDINMDGTVDVADAMLALIDYTNYLVAGNPHTLTDAQIELADVDGVSKESFGITSKVTSIDALLILAYYTETVSDPSVINTDIVTWAKEKYPFVFEKEDAP